MDKCLECEKSNCLIIDEEQGNIVCTNCGRVNIWKMIDEGAEWRNFSEEIGEDPRRVGMPNNDLLSDKGIGTTVSESYLKKWAMRSSFSNLDSALLKTFSEIEQVCDSIGLSSTIIEKSKKLFKHIYLKKVTRGKSHMGIVCSCIFITCRKLKNMCPVFEIARACSVDKTKLHKAFLLVREFANDIFPASNSQVVAKKYAEKFNFCDSDLKKMEKIVDEINELNVCRDDESVVATMAVYIMNILKGRIYEIEQFSNEFNADTEKMKQVYKVVYSKRFKILSDIASQWEIANL